MLKSLNTIKRRIKMKKLSILLVLFVLTTAFTFAQESSEEEDAVNSQRNGTQSRTNESEKKERVIELFNLELSFNFPIHWTNGRHTDVFYAINEPSPSYTLEDKFVTANTSIGIGTIFNFTRIIGLGMDLDLFFGGKLAGFSNPSSDYNSLFGINAFIGPIFYLYNDDILRMPLSFGGHLYYFKDDLWISDYETANGAWFSRSDLQFGPAISLAVQFHFENSIYIFSRTQLAIDIVRMHKIYTDNKKDQAIQERAHTDIVTGVNWGIKPTLGIGIRK